MAEARGLFARRRLHRLRAADAVAARLEALSGRADGTNLDRQASDSINRKTPARRIRTTVIPMWIGDKVYFLSDRNGAVCALLPSTRNRRQVTATGQQQRSRHQIGVGRSRGSPIAYEQFGTHSPLRHQDRTRRERSNIRVAAIWSAVRPRYEKVGDRDISTPTSRRPARAPSLKRAARSSPSRRKKATRAT